MTRSRFPLYVWLFTLLVLVASVISSSVSLPPQVATHFNADGDPDGWMSRSGAIVSFLGFSIGMSAFILGLVFCIRFFPASSLNVPRQDFWRTADNYPRACRFLFAHTFWLAAANNLFMCALFQSLVSANSGAGDLVLRGVGLTTCLFIVAVIVWGVLLIRFFMKAPNAPAS